jgi:hypothetical protein
MKTVQAWFDNGCNYQDGVQLYAGTKHCKPVLLRNFQGKENAQLLEKLKYELRKELPAVPGPVPPKKTTAATAKKIVPAQTGAAQKTPEEPDPKKILLFHQLPTELRPVLLLANTLFKENCMLKTQLNDLPAKAESEALDLQLKIYANFKKNALCWQKIDYWRAHGSVLQVADSEFVKMTPDQRVKRQALLWSSSSRLKDRIDKTELELAAATSIKDKTRLAKKMAKQKSNLLRQETQLQELTRIIDGHE